MNRSVYFDYVEEKVNTLATRINSRGRLNILNLHIHSENFYAYLLNELYGWNLKNENPFKQNIEAIDLIDHTNKYVIQVSATNTKQKVELSLEKDIIKDYSSYTFKFISIANDTDDLKGKVFKNPFDINFNSKNDIIDKKSILNFILNSQIDDQRRIYDFIKKELGSDSDVLKLDSNLATIISILSKENWNVKNPDIDFDPFEINRKIDHNNLKASRRIIDDYKIYHNKVEKKYEEFDSLGANKSYSVLQLIGKYYVEESVKSGNSDEVFLSVTNRVVQKVQESGNFEIMESDILILCVDILVVDAFIRCKIFENPENYKHAFTR
jgi:hypothetical protein